MDKSEKIKSIIDLLNIDFFDFLKNYNNNNYSNSFKTNILNLHSTNIINKMHSELTEAGSPSPKSLSPINKLTKIKKSPSFKPTKTRKGTVKYYHEKMIECARFKIGDEFNMGYRDEHKIKILNELSIREDTILYIGEVIKSNSINDKRIIVKIQPRYNKELLSSIIKEKIINKSDLRIPFQVTTEFNIMSQFANRCPNALVSQAHLYGSVKIPNQIERYVLLSTELYRDLTILKGSYIDIIKKSTLLALTATKKFHECGFLHMDIKHENMMFSTDKMDEVKLIDFGSTVDVFDRKNNRRLDEPNKFEEGTPLYMSIGQHEKNIKDYMDDLQAFAWMLLDLLSDRVIMQGMPWCGFNYKEICDKKIEFINNANNGFPNKIYNDSIIGGNINNNNLIVIGELAIYTNKRFDLVNKYSTDKYQTQYNYYYTDFNDNYYKDIAKIINKLE